MIGRLQKCICNFRHTWGSSSSNADEGICHTSSSLSSMLGIPFVMGNFLWVSMHTRFPSTMSILNNNKRKPSTSVPSNTSSSSSRVWRGDWRGRRSEYLQQQVMKCPLKLLISLKSLRPLSWNLSLLSELFAQTPGCEPQRNGRRGLMEEEVGRYAVGSQEEESPVELGGDVHNEIRVKVSLHIL